jgi:hypothetical protein
VIFIKNIKEFGIYCVLFWRRGASSRELVSRKP